MKMWQFNFILASIWLATTPPPGGSGLTACEHLICALAFCILGTLTIHKKEDAPPANHPGDGEKTMGDV